MRYKNHPNPEVTENAWLTSACSFQVHNFFLFKKKKKKEYTHGGINDMSVLDPLPGDVGFIKVVSMRVQPSPLNPQLPG